MLYATRQYIEALTTALSGDTGIKFREGKNWSADVKNKILIYPVADLTQYDMNIARGLILHEAAHLIYTKDNKPTKLEKTVPAIHDVYNAFEDIRIERKMFDKYGDFASEALGITKNAIALERTKQADDKPYTQLHRLLCQTIYATANNGGLGQERYVTTNGLHHGYNQMTEMTKMFYDDKEYSLLGIAIKAMNADTLDELKRIVDEQAYPVLKELIDKIKNDDIPPTPSSPVSEAPHQLNGGNKGDIVRLPSDKELSALLAPYIHTLSKKLQDILNERRCTRFSGLHNNGRLLSKNTYRVLTDEARIFSRKTNPDKADYKIQLLLDDSGSMRGNRHKNTYVGAYLLQKAFNKIPVDVSIIRFNDEVEIIPLSEYRDHNGGGNDDREALNTAINGLDPNKENIVLVLSDGSICTKIAEPLAILRKRGAIVVGVGVGISTDELRKYYGQAVNVPEVSELPIALINILKKLIAR